MNYAKLNWVKAAASANAGECVELARQGDAVFVRDSKNPDGPVHQYTLGEARAWVKGAKDGDFDDLLA